jgi:hypothetical protein
MGARVAIGTVKGGFLLRLHGKGNTTLEGPFFKGWKVTSFAQDHKGTYLVGTASDVYGTALQRSQDLRKFKQVEQGPAYPQDGKRKLNQIWRILATRDALWAGVDEAGLFRSLDGGMSWHPVEGLNEHETRSAWQPGAGGLCAHAILAHPTDPNRLYCGISAVGTFRSDDGGATWEPKNDGVPVILEDAEHKGIGYCVHALVLDPDEPDTIYRQDHRGMYKSTDAADTWVPIENGLRERSFGFPIAVDPKTRALFCVPLESDEYRMPSEGKLRVFRSTDRGDSWHPLTRGLPQDNAYGGVLRSALTTDDGSGVYLGTTSGTFHYSTDAGESWNKLDAIFPRILTVQAFGEE